LFDMLFALAGAVGLRSIWWNVALVVLQAWAGYELVRMSVQSKVVATAFGIAGIAISLYLYWPVLSALRHSEMLGREVVLFGPLALNLILPVATILLIHRKIAPTARARFRR